MSKPIGITIPEGCLGLVYDMTTREVKAYFANGSEYHLKSWRIKLVDAQGNTTEITRREEAPF